MEENNNKETLQNVLFIIGIILFVSFIYVLIVYKNTKALESNTNNNKEEANPIVEEDNGIIDDVPTIEEPEEEPIDIEIPQKVDKGIHEGFEKKLKNLGFKKYTNKDKCLENNICYYKEPFFVSYNNSVWLEIEREIKNFKEFDTKKDLEFIGNLYGNKKLVSKSTVLNKVLNNADNDSFLSFLNIDGFHFYMSANKNRNRFSVANYYAYDDPSSIIDRLEIGGREKFNKKIFLESTFGDYKNRFPLYDFENNYKYYIEDQSIEISIEQSNYNYKVKLSPYGQSYAYEVDSSSRTNTKVDISIPGKLFEGNIIKMINTDLEYFTTKYDRKYVLSENNVDKIRKYIASNDEKIYIEVDTSLNIEINNYVNGLDYHLIYNTK